MVLWAPHKYALIYGYVDVFMDENQGKSIPKGWYALVFQVLLPSKHNVYSLDQFSFELTCYK